MLNQKFGGMEIHIRTPWCLANTSIERVRSLPGLAHGVQDFGAKKKVVAGALVHGNFVELSQATFGYTQNAVVRVLTPGAPDLAAIVEELFPIEATKDLHAFFGATDDADLSDRMNRMVASTSAFGANKNVDTVPTSRYEFRSPFSRKDVE